MAAKSKLVKVQPTKVQPTIKAQPISKIRRGIIEQLTDDEEVMFLEGAEFDDAIVGLLERFGLAQRIVCYDYDKVLEVLRNQGMDADEAVEWYDYNIIGAWMGDATPCFVNRPPHAH